MVDGWRCSSEEPGRHTSKHEVWETTLPAGDVLRTVVSKGRNPYPKGLFARILKRQLRVTASQFWRAVDKGVPPDRPQARTTRPGGEPLPYHLVQQLLAAGITLDELRGLSAAEAERLLDGR